MDVNTHVLPPERKTHILSTGMEVRSVLPVLFTLCGVVEYSWEMVMLFMTSCSSDYSSFLGEGRDGVLFLF